MRSKSTVIFSLMVVPLMLTACDGQKILPEENIVGEPLDVISSVSGADNTQTLNMFDETTRRIHTFDLNNMEMIQSTEVMNPFDQHYVIASDDESYFADLSAGNLSLYNYDGSKDENFISFLGKPVSSAYNKSARTLVVYDDLNSVALVKIAENGRLEKSWVGGPIITGEQSIQAGDIIDSGELVLSLINGSFAIVDIETSIDQQRWVYTLDTTVPHSGVKWIASAGGSQVLYQNDEVLVLYDLNSQTVLDANTVPTDNYTVAYSKTKDPHVIYKEKAYLGSKRFVAYAQAGEIKVREFINLREGRDFHQSRLDLDQDRWSYIGSGLGSENKDQFDGGVLLISDTNRHMVTHRLSDMLVLNSEDLPSEAYLKRAQDYVFALYPSELGYAEKYDFNRSRAEVVKNFNIGFITPDLEKNKKEKEEGDGDVIIIFP